MPLVLYRKTNTLFLRYRWRKKS